MAKGVTISALLLLVVMSGVLGAVNPGVKLKISQAGLNYAAQQALASLAGQVQGQSIPDQSGSAHTAIGKVKYELSSMQVTSFSPGAASAVVNPSGLTLQIANVGVNVHGHWHYEYKKIIKIKDSGSFDVSVQGASISVRILLGIDSPTSGRPTIVSSSCADDVQKVKVKFHGGASWLYNLFDDNVAKSLKSNLKDLLCKSALKAINEDAAKKLATLKVTVPIKGIGSLDYRLTSAPAFYNGFIEAGFKVQMHLTSLILPHDNLIQGEVFWTGDATEAPFSPPVVSDPPRDMDMLTIWLTDYIINTLTYVVHKHGVLNYDLTPNDLDPKDRGVLNTTCSSLICMGNVLPKIVREKFPNSAIAVAMATSKPPTLAISPAGVHVAFEGHMNFSVFPLESNERTLLFSTFTTVDAVLKAELKDKKIVASVETMKPTLKVIDSSIGEIPSDALTGAFQFASDFFVKNKINDVLKEGIALPDIDNVEYVNPSLILMKGAVCLTTDVRYAPDEKLYFKSWNEIHP
ncbi:hypothetical protein CAPTEDRAFT_224086 [Capitella teleta]|uniref:Bactericidal permeability-increasing protein n=1 Tax=Capitella teleta TaxID=283909 RepID=R7T9Z2_CAPTE|nr:hypothetical protein CAPTEDRAFT_224086 [Capitella teleta]|eukprot:ELT87829.1 hypothetical protein CAPTEDRAFT_224086 [Capitella teleta]